VSLEEINERELGQTLLALARGTLAAELAKEPLRMTSADWLRERAASFVTLHRDDELRGCIGTIVAHRPLGEDVQSNARAAAFSDPRFPPLAARELAAVTIEVSLLSELEPLEFESEQDLVSRIRPGVDGLLLEHGFHRGTFLPAVWRSLSEPGLFLRNLKVKAGLQEDFWSPEIVVRRYQTRSWSEAADRP
jgi:AmmeMemoRadiSam system protein A